MSPQPGYLTPEEQELLAQGQAIPEEDLPVDDQILDDGLAEIPVEPSTDGAEELPADGTVDSTAAEMPEAPPVAPPSSAPPDLSTYLPDQSVMAAIRARRDSDVATSDLLRGATQIGASLAGAKADVSTFDAAREQANLRSKEATEDQATKQKGVAAYLKAKTDKSKADDLAKHRSVIETQGADRLKAQEKAAAAQEMHRKTNEAMTKARLANDSLRTQIAKQATEFRGKGLALREKSIENATNGMVDRLMNGANTKKEIQKLTAASGAQSLIDEIRSGKLKDSKNIANQLTNLISTIEMGGPGDAQGRHEMGVDTAYTDMAALLQYYSGKPQSAIPTDLLNQLETEVGALGDRAAKNYKGITDASLAGADNSAVDPTGSPGELHARMLARQKKFLQGVGFDPETGERINKKGKSPHGTKLAANAPDTVTDGVPGFGSGLTPEARRAKIAELRARKAQKNATAQ